MSARADTFELEAAPSLLTGLSVSARVRRVARSVWLLAALTPPALLLVPWQQNVLGVGAVVARDPGARQQVLEAPLEGRVVRWHVREAERVQAGAPLVELTDNDPSLPGRLLEQRDGVARRIEALEREAEAHEAHAAALGEARLQAIAGGEERVSMARERTRAAAQALEAALGQEEAARLHRQRQGSLLERGLVSQRTLELAEADAVRARAEVERARAALDAARRDESSLASERERAGAELAAREAAARAAAEKARADLGTARAELARAEVARARQGTQVVRAPRDGTVVRFLGGLGGEIVRAGDPLLLFVPEAVERAVELLLDGNDAPLVREGRAVRIQFEGWPAVQFVGWPSVAVGTFGGRVTFVDATESGGGRFRVLVVPDPAEPWPEGRYLRQGVRAKGWVLLDQVPLGYELWRRLNGFPPALTSGAPTREGTRR